MDYVIFDFEWNNAYDYKSRKGINEIIEITEAAKVYMIHSNSKL